MNMFLKICSIVSIIISAVKLAINGGLSQGMVIFIIICGILILAGNRKVFIITSAIAALVLFVKYYGVTPSGELALLQSILTLTIVCFGLYIMFGGAFRNRKASRYR